jgi:hypothetical protein
LAKVNSFRLNEKSLSALYISLYFTQVLTEPSVEGPILLLLYFDRHVCASLNGSFAMWGLSFGTNFGSFFCNFSPPSSSLSPPLDPRRRALCPRTHERRDLSYFLRPSRPAALLFHCFAKVGHLQAQILRLLQSPDHLRLLGRFENPAAFPRPVFVRYQPGL